MPVTEQPKLSLATVIEIRQGITDIRAAVKDGPKSPNIWGFFSQKNNQILTLIGDVTFIQAVLLEGDPHVNRYTVIQDITADTPLHKYGSDLLVQNSDGSQHWLYCGREKSLRKNPTAAVKKNIDEKKLFAERIGAEFFLRTEIDFSERMTEFRNWLTLCAAMTRARDFSTENENSILIKALDEYRSVSIRALLEMAYDPALMLSTISKSIAKGLIDCNLKEAELNIDCQIFHSKYISKNPIHETKAKPNPKPFVELLIPPHNRRTERVPTEWRNLYTWPCPNPDLLKYPDSFRNNKKAIEMYIANRDYKSIQEETNLKEDWVRKLFKKCITIHADGKIMGFRGLVKYGDMTRKEYCRHIPPPNSVLNEEDSPGYAGSFIQLLERFPDELLELIEINILKIRAYKLNKLLEAKISWKDLQKEVLKFLERKGVKKDEYPFNTNDRCYNSIAKIGRSLIFNKPIQFISARFGKGAGEFARRGAGISPLIQATAPFQVMELDFHKHDSAAVVDITTPIGNTIACNVPRWWIGCLIDEHNRAVLGTCDSFESQTTETSVLELIDSALAPMTSIKSSHDRNSCVDNRWLPNQFLEDIQFHSWDILKLDRALAHQSTNTLSTLIATTGCAVCFSKPRSWWARSIVERTFNELTRLGAQRLPTTYGTGPTDLKRNNPQGAATTIHFVQTEMCDLARGIVKEINETAKEGVFWESPINNLRRITGMENYFPRPLPLARRNDRPTQWCRFKVRIEANPTKGISPSIRVHRCRYYGVDLYKSWGLVGTYAILEINRYDIRIARLVSEQTGMLIDSVVPERRWRLYRISYQNFVMIQKYGRIFSDMNRPVDPVMDFKEHKGREIEMATKGKKKCMKVISQQIANLDHDLNNDQSTTSNLEKIIEPSNNKAKPTIKPVNLSPMPEITSFPRGR